MRSACPCLHPQGETRAAVSGYAVNKISKSRLFAQFLERDGFSSIVIPLPGRTRGHASLENAVEKQKGRREAGLSVCQIRSDQ
jgi:hypothetical protein